MSAGYVVTNERTNLLMSLLKKDNALWKKVPSEGVLLCNPKTATVFTTRKQAQRAIRVTKAYHLARARVHPNSLVDDEYAVIRLVPDV